MTAHTMILTCVRPAQAETLPITRNHLKRPLSPKGKEQALETLGLLVDPFFNLVLCSPQGGAQETARIIGGESPETIIKPCLGIPTSFDNHQDDKNFIELLNTLGCDTPLLTYLGDIKQQLQPGGQERHDSLIRFGERVWKSVWENWTMQTLREREQESRVLVVGHPIILTLMGFVADPLTNHSLSAHKMKECGAFNILWQNDDEYGSFVDLTII